MIFGSAAPQSGAVRQLLCSAVDGRPRRRAFRRCCRCRARTPARCSPDGQRIAYEEFATEFETKEAQLQSAQWRHYRGGRTHPIRVHEAGRSLRDRAPLDETATTAIRCGSATRSTSSRTATSPPICSHIALNDGTLKQLTRHDDFDIMNASAGPDAVVYEQAGFVHLLDARTASRRDCASRSPATSRGREPHFRKPAADLLRNARCRRWARVRPLKRAARFSSVPAETAESRNLTRIIWRARSLVRPGRQTIRSSHGSRTRAASISCSIADQTAGDKPAGDRSAARRVISRRRSGRRTGQVAPAEDNHLTLWMIDIASGRATALDADTYDEPGQRFEPVVVASIRAGSPTRRTSPITCARSFCTRSSSAPRTR